ncbi:hypothetical protein HG530_003515 [Fusarium avenaceum]|nr:hypothetical protein HG530_003515 [Fusarium avenaceum]
MASLLCFLSNCPGGRLNHSEHKSDEEPSKRVVETGTVSGAAEIPKCPSCSTLPIQNRESLECHLTVETPLFTEESDLAFRVTSNECHDYCLFLAALKAVDTAKLNAWELHAFDGRSMQRQQSVKQSSLKRGTFCDLGAIFDWRLNLGIDRLDGRWELQMITGTDDLLGGHERDPTLSFKSLAGLVNDDNIKFFVS